MERKVFASDKVLSVVTGNLICEIGGVYDVLNWMTDENLYTHQLPRIADEAKPLIIALHPALQQACDEAKWVTRENWREWQRTWIDRYGDELTVPKMTRHEHESIDPLSELVEKVPPDNIIIIKA